MHLSSYCLVFSKSICAVALRHLVFAVFAQLTAGRAHPVEEAREVHTENQKIQGPQVWSQAGHSCGGWLPAHLSRNQPIRRAELPTPSAWPHRVQKG